MNNQPNVQMESSGVPGANKRPSGFRRVVRFVLILFVVIIALVAIANWLWINSGSNQWELKVDKDGAQVYTLKTPGSYMLKVKGVTQSKEFTLSNHLAPFLDKDIQNNCAAWVEGCIRYDIIKPWDARTQTNVTMWTVALFPPFSPREFLLQGQLSQDPDTKVVTLSNIAVPNAAPLNDCCVRLNHVHNVWHYTPLEDGVIKIEFLSDFDMGGLFPGLMLNLGSADAIHKMLVEDNPKLLRNEKYRNVSLEFIDEGKPSVKS